MAGVGLGHAPWLVIEEDGRHLLLQASTGEANRWGIARLSGSREHGGMLDGFGRRVVLFPDDGHPEMCALDIMLLRHSMRCRQAAVRRRYGSYGSSPNFSWRRLSSPVSSLTTPAYSPFA